MNFAPLFRGLRLGAALSSLALAALAQETVPASADAVPIVAGPQAGDMAPDFTVVGPDGKEMKLSDFRGKKVLLDIWATWCGPCIASMPHNSELAEKYAKDDLVILAVCASDTRANYHGWVRRNGTKYKFLTAHDPAGKDFKNSVFNTKYGVTGFPSLYLIDRDGRLIGRTAGGGPNENPSLTRLLAKGGIPIPTAHLPPENPDAPKSVPMVGKTAATPAGGMMGGMMGAASASGGRFGSVAAGTAVPDLKFPGASGEVKLSDSKGKVTILTFYSNSERGPEPYLVAAFERYRAKGVAMLAVATAQERAQFDAFVAKAKPSYTAAWDPAGKAFMESAAHMEFGVGMFPAIGVIDRDGKVVGGYIGIGDRNAPLLLSHLQKAGVELDADDAAKAKSVPAAAIAARPAAPAGGTTANKAPATLAAGAVAPDFTMQTVEGKVLRLSDFKGKVVVLDFWATWCGPCIASFPHTQDLAKKYKDQDVVVLASGTSDTIAKFKEWIPRNAPKYPDMVWAFDTHERGSATFEERASSKLYGVTGIPTQFVIGRDGKVVSVIVGNGGKDDARTETALAAAGVKVDEAIVAKGREQVARSEAADRERAAAAATRPPFSESFGKLKSGEPVGDLTLEDANGDSVKLSEVSRGKTVVLVVWGLGGDPAQIVGFYDNWVRKYSNQGMQVVGLAAYGAREDYRKWMADNAGKYSFPILFDPAGPMPRPAKPVDEMSEEEKTEFSAKSREHFAKVAPLRFTGGAMAPIPNACVIDAQGKFVGFYAGFGPGSSEPLANLLLRAGLKLAADDMPQKVWTAADVKAATPAPEARREMLKVGAMAPDFETTDPAGRPVKLSDYRGKVVVLDFWATWCGPCLAAMPHTQEVAAQYKDQGVVVLGSCTSDTREKFEQWVKANQEKYPDIVWSHDAAARGPDRASYAKYGVSGIPTQFVIDREGRIVDIVIGYLKGEVILDAALAKAGVKVDPAVVAKGAADLRKRGS